MEALLASDIDYTIFFYNPNIHPRREYELRKDENIAFAEKHNIPFIDCDYDTDNWFARAKGMEWEPERGKRCTMCFDMRFERTALYAHEKRLSGDYQLAWHQPLEKHEPNQRKRPARRRALSGRAVLDVQLAQGRRLAADDRNQQARTLLYAGILRLRLFRCATPTPGA